MTGWKPRSLVFLNCLDALTFFITGSTEWGQNTLRLQLCALSPVLPLPVKQVAKHGMVNYPGAGVWEEKRGLSSPPCSVSSGKHASSQL